MLNPKLAVYFSIAGDNTFSGGLLKASRIPNGIDALPNLCRRHWQGEGVEVMADDLEDCHIALFVVILKHRHIRLSRVAAYDDCCHTSAPLYYMGICNDEAIRRDQNPTCLR